MVNFSVVVSNDNKLWEHIMFIHYDFPQLNYYYFWGLDEDYAESESVQDFFRENDVEEKQVQELTEIIFKICGAERGVCVKIENSTIFIVTE